MDASKGRFPSSAYWVRIVVVATFSLATAIVIGTRASLDARPAVAPLALAVGAALVLWAIDRRTDALRDRDVGARWMRIGLYLMAGSTVLGVANTWYAFLDPSRNGWISALFLVGSVLAAAAFLWLDPSRRSRQSAPRI